MKCQFLKSQILSLLYRTIYYNNIRFDDIEGREPRVHETTGHYGAT